MHEVITVADDGFGPAHEPTIRSRRPLRSISTGSPVSMI